jgi:PIN domain nuclease of toxin-antitoxin system
VKLLLDTHALLWTINRERQLPAALVDLIEDAQNDVYVSMASIWEATIKIGLGKLRVPGQTIDYLIGHIEAHNLTVLAVTLAHMRALQRLPQIHRDPFDRMLVAQAQANSLTLLTIDADIALYDVSTLWR